MSKSYIVITLTEDGTYIENLSESELLNDLNNPEDPPTFLDSCHSGDVGEWPLGKLIIKGEIIVPKPKTVVSTYEL